MEARRGLREEMIALYSIVERSISYENKISKYTVSVDKMEDPQFLILLDKLSKTQTRMLKKRLNLK